MLKFRHNTLIAISGLIWVVVGISLLSLGIGFLMEGSDATKSANFPFVSFLKQYTGNFEQAALLITVMGLTIGYFKGRYVLGKSATKGIERILSFSNPTHIKNIYSAKYYLLLGLMVTLGISIKYLGIPKDVRGLVDIAIGSALTNGAMFYFRAAFRTCSKSSIS